MTASRPRTAKSARSGSPVGPLTDGAAAGETGPDGGVEGALAAVGHRHPE